MRPLLDAHLPPALARELQRRGVDAVALAHWQEGGYRGAPDDQLLALAYADRRVLVTYDCQTIPPLLKEWLETGQHHGGVILVDEHTIRPGDVGGLLRAIQQLALHRGDDDWVDQVVFLGRP